MLPAAAAAAMNALAPMDHCRGEGVKAALLATDSTEGRRAAEEKERHLQGRGKGERAGEGRERGKGKMRRESGRGSSMCHDEVTAGLQVQ